MCQHQSCSSSNSADLQDKTPRVRAKQWMQDHWQQLLQQLQAAGWETGRVTLAQSDCTAEWGQALQSHDE